MHISTFGWISLQALWILTPPSMATAVSSSAALSDPGSEVRGHELSARIPCTGANCQTCEGLTCAGACNTLGCGQTCRCTGGACSLFCPNGNCHSCCSCFISNKVGVADVVATHFDNTVYVVNQTQVPADRSNMDTLHSELSKVNQTWWQHDNNGNYYELKELKERTACGNGPACFSCQLSCSLVGGNLGCYSSCQCTHTSVGCNISCSARECLTQCSCNKIGE